MTFCVYGGQLCQIQGLYGSIVVSILLIVVVVIMLNITENYLRLRVLYLEQKKLLCNNIFIPHFKARPHHNAA